MRFTLNILDILNVFKPLFSITDNYVLKTDDENLDRLLTSPQDRIKFDNAVQELKRSNMSSKEIQLESGKKITISI